MSAGFLPENEFAAALKKQREREDRERQATMLRLGVDRARAVSPDTAARASRAAEKGHLAYDFLRENPDALPPDGPDLSKVQTDSPVLAEFWTNQENLDSSIDDYEPLSLMEQLFGTSKERGAFGKGMETARLQNRMGDILAKKIVMNQDLSPDEEAEVTRIEEQLAQRSPFEDRALFPRLLEKSAESIIGNLWAAREEAAAGVVVGGAAGSVVPGVGTLVGAGVGIRAGMGAQMFKVESAQIYRSMIADGVDPDTARAAAIAYGAVAGGLESVAPLRIAGQVAKPARNALVKAALLGAYKNAQGAFERQALRKGLLQFGKAAAVNPLMEGTTEGLQATAEVLTRKTVSGLTGGTDTASWSQVQEEFWGGVEAAILPGLAGGAGVYASTRQEQRAAQRAQDFMTALSDLSQRSKLVSRLPKKAQELIQRMGDATELSQVTVDKAGWDEAFREMGYDPRAIYEEVTGSTQGYEEAEQSGAVVVPIGAWATKIANRPEIHEKLMKDTRLRDGDRTPREIEAANEKARADAQMVLGLIEQEKEKIAAEDASEESFDKSFVQPFIEEQVATGRMTKANAERSALQMRAFLRAQVARFNDARAEEGKDPLSAEQLFQGYSLKVIDGEVALVAPDRAAAQVPQEAFVATRMPNLVGGRFSTKFTDKGIGGGFAGWGLYFSRLPEVAERYAKVFEARSGQDAGRFQVDLPEDTDLLDFDKSMSDQPERVLEALSRTNDPTIKAIVNGSIAKGQTAWGFYKALSEQFYRRRMFSTRDYERALTLSRKDASLALKRLGIAGAIHLDPTTPTRSGAPAPNFVIWDDSKIKMTGKFAPVAREMMQETDDTDHDAEHRIVPDSTGRRVNENQTVEPAVQEQIRASVRAVMLKSIEKGMSPDADHEASLTPEEESRAESVAEEMIERWRKILARHPIEDGWAPLEFGRVLFDEKTSKWSPESVAQPYSYDRDKPGGKEFEGEARAQRVREMAQRSAKEMLTVAERAAAGDPNAKVIMRQAGWYREFRKQMRRQFGGLADYFADILAATSPQTNVKDNFRYAVEILERAIAGDFDEIIPQVQRWYEERELALQAAREAMTEYRARTFREVIEASIALEEATAAAQAVGKKSTPETKEAQKRLSAANRAHTRAAGFRDPQVSAAFERWKSLRAYNGTMPKQRSGALYNTNSKLVAEALGGMWRRIRTFDPVLNIEGSSPKTKTFSGNLAGYIRRATIDVWAARHLRRLAHEQYGGFPRIAPQAETGVRGTFDEAGIPDQEYGFGQDVLAEAAALLDGSGVPEYAGLNPDDYQAMAWFVEKELWGNNSWSDEVGGSFEAELAKIASERYWAGISTSTSEAIPTDKDMAKVADDIRRAADPGDGSLLAVKVLPSMGHYDGYTERSFDTEIIGRAGFNPLAGLRKIIEVARLHNQECALLGRVMAPGEEDTSPNARPLYELTFAAPADAEAWADSPQKAALDAAGVRSYSFVVSPVPTPATASGVMPKIIGIRLAVVPEFDRDTYRDLDDQQIEQALDAQVQAWGQATDALYKSGTIIGSTVSWTDLRVVWKEEYDGLLEELSRPVPDGADLRSHARAVWAGQSVRESVARADRLAAERSAADGGAVPGGDGQSPGEVEQSFREDEERALADRERELRTVESQAQSATDPNALSALRGRRDDLRKDIERLRYALRQDSPGGQRRKRQGSLVIPRGAGPRAFIMKLFGAADLSTVLHESSHFYLELLGDLSAREDAPASLKADYAVLLDWFGVKDRSQITMLHHEKFARSFEQYLLEGRAPSLYLARAFARYRAWLVQIYRDVKGLQDLYRRLHGEELELNDQVRRVFDRMLATDDEIAHAEKMHGYTALFESAEAMGEDQAAYAQYLERQRLAHEEAIRTLNDDMMSDLRKETAEWLREETERTEEEVREEATKLRVYALARQLETAPLSSEEALRVLGEKRFNALKRKYRGAFSRKGANLKEVADLFAYGSPAEMLDELAEALPFEKFVKEETKQRMQAAHDAILQDEAALRDKANEAVHGDARAELLLFEMDKLSRGGAGGRIAKEAFRLAASMSISKKAIKDLKPERFRVQEARAARLAYQAAKKGDLMEAARQKRLQIANFYFYREALAAQERTEKARRYFQRIQRPSTLRRIGKAGKEFLDQLANVLGAYSLADESLASIEQRTTIEKWIAAQEEEGRVPVVPDAILERLRREPTNWREASVEEFLSLYDTVKNIDHLASQKLGIKIAGQEFEEEQIVAMMLRSLQDNVKNEGHLPYERGSQEWYGRVSKWWRGARGQTLRPEEMIARLDGGDANGIWAQIFMIPFAKAQKLEMDLQKKITESLLAHMARIPKTVRESLDDQVQLRTLGGQTMSRRAVIAAVLNMGNLSNREKLLKGYMSGAGGRVPWTEETLQELLDTLTKEEMDFVQGVWDTLETLWPDIEALERRVTGLPPPRVERVPLHTKHGVYPGGYYPAVYDPRTSGRQMGYAMESLGGFYKPTANTPHGYVQKRIDTYASEILLDLDVISNHVMEVVHDLTHREAVLQAARFLKKKEIWATLNQYIGEESAMVLRNHLSALADPYNKGDAGTFGNMMDYFRSNLTLAIMGWKATTIFQNLANVGNAVEVLSEDGENGARWFAAGTGEFYADREGMVEWVKTASPEMAHRFRTWDADVRRALKQFGKKESALNSVKKTAFAAQAITDLMVAYPTWIGAYRLAESKGMDHEEAVNFADSKVRKGLGAGGVKDMSQIQRSGALRYITMFYSFMGTVLNRQRSIYRDTMRAVDQGTLARQFPSLFLRQMMISFWVPAMGELLSGRWAGKEDPDESWLWWFAKKSILFPFQLVPVIRDIVSGLERGQGARITPLQDVYDKGERAIRSVAGAAKGEKEWTDAMVVAAEAAGTVVGAPVAQTKITGTYLYDLAVGADEIDSADDLLYLFYNRPRERRDDAKARR